MKEHPYFNPFRKHHVDLLAFLEEEVSKNKNHKVEMVKFGDNTQHIFINNKYYMSINWALV